MSEDGCEREAWLYLAATVPVSAIVGPAGALFASYTHRQVQAGLIYVLDTLALVSTEYRNTEYAIVMVMVQKRNLRYS